MPASAAMDKHAWNTPPGHSGDAGNGNGWSHGHGNGGGGGGKGHGHGHGNGGDSSSGQSAAPQAAATTAAPETSKGHGNGNGHGNGHGNGGASSSKHATTNTSPNTNTNTGASAAGATPTGSASPPPTTSTPATHSGNQQAGRGHRRGRHARHSGGKSAARGHAAPGKASPTTARLPGAKGAGLASAPAASRARSHGKSHKDGSGGSSQGSGPATVVRTLEHVVQVIPTFVKAIIVVLGAMLVIAAFAWFLLARTALYLRRQRTTLLGEIGVLQGALLPNVPAELSRLEASVAYKPAEGLAAGGDFYDAFPLDDGRVGIVVGDVAGHGKDALMHTALLRYTLRAYLEADLEPRTAMQVAGRALDRGFDTLATVVLAVYDPARHVLRYSSAGHPPPVFLGQADHVPVTKASSPPIGAGLPTGLRQTTVWLPAGSAVCFFTDGLIEARRDDRLIGRLGLVDIIRELGPRATAKQLLERVAVEADRIDDDMAACMFRVSDGPAEAASPRVEELEVSRQDPVDVVVSRFLAACGVASDRIPDVVQRAERTVRQFRGAVVRVALPASGPQIEVVPANVESFASAEVRRAAAGARG